MIRRIVKMTFQEGRSEDFKEFAASIGDTIRNFDGCEHLDILRDINNSNIFFSYSLWQREEDLNSYRESSFFKVTWNKARQWFAAKPEAWSTEKI